MNEFDEKSTSINGRSPESTFRNWRLSQDRNGILPIIGVSGSRGKTTVIQLLDAIFSEAGLRTAAKTDAFVAIRGKRQRGEITPWLSVRDELGRGTLDVAVEEIDWVTIQSMGLMRETYPLFAVTNVSGHRDTPLVHTDARRALSVLPTIIDATSIQGDLVLTGDELIISQEAASRSTRTTFVGLNRESPGLRGHLANGRESAWVENGWLWVGSSLDPQAICRSGDLEVALFGKAGFQLQNALMAAAISYRIGIPVDSIRNGLLAFRSDARRMPSSFHYSEIDEISIVIDRPNPSWFLRPVIRTLRDLNPGRIISVVGKLPNVPEYDLQETGRLLGRASSVLITHSQEDAQEISVALRMGAAARDVPPMIVHAKSLNKAIARALAMARKGDLIFVLTDHQESISRLFNRRNFGSPGAQAAVVFA